MVGEVFFDLHCCGWIWHFLGLVVIKGGAFSYKGLCWVLPRQMFWILRSLFALLYVLKGISLLVDGVWLLPLHLSICEKKPSRASTLGGLANRLWENPGNLSQWPTSCKREVLRPLPLSACSVKGALQQSNSQSTSSWKTLIFFFSCTFDWIPRKSSHFYGKDWV